MKILFYINVLNNGGAERVMTNLANELCKRHEIVLVNSFKTEKEYFLDPSINHLYLDNNSYDNTVIKNIERIRKLRKILKKENPAIAISFMAEPNFRLILSNLFLPTKSIISIRNDPNREYPNFVFKGLARTLYRLADGIVFQTKDAQDFFSSKIQKKSKIIYNPVKNDFFEQKRSSDPRGIIAVGRLTEQKNHKLLIEAYSMITKEIEEELFIYGTGDLFDDLSKMINLKKLNKKVHLMGNVSNIQEVLPNHKLYILSSDYEGMPNSLMEAMAIGLPCISTDCPCGGPRELLPEECLVEIKNVDKLSDKIIEFLSNENKLNEQSELNNLKAREFKNSNIIHEWEKFIEIIKQR